MVGDQISVASIAERRQLLKWNSRYPDPSQLRTEARAGAEAFVQALQELIPARDIAGIYFKGSSLKQWDSPLDYVPTLSDVDVHVLFGSEEEGGFLNDIAHALSLSRRAEEIFRQMVPRPIHIPRAQIVVANRLFSDPNYIPSPIDTVEERFGIPYPRRPLDVESSRRIAVEITLSPENQQMLGKLSDRVADLFGPHLRPILRDLSWRVSPSAPRILELLGIDFNVCWTSNRTKLVELLHKTGEARMAEDYTMFYLEAWDYFMSEDRDGEPARRAILAAWRLLGRAMEIAQSAASTQELFSS